MKKVELIKNSDTQYSLSGELDFNTVPVIWKKHRKLFQREGILSIDLSGVTRANGAGLALLIEWMRDAEKNNTQLQYLNIPPQMLAVARVSSLDEVLPLGRTASSDASQVS